MDETGNIVGGEVFFTQPGKLVSRAYLWEEWQKALQGGMTEDCRDGECQNCGVCDFTSIQPRVFPEDGSARRPEDRTAAPPPEIFRQFQLTFAKTGGGRFWGHLEMVNIFIRALRRSGITVKFSEGFHPKPKMAFGDALPIGLESLCETMLLTVSDNIRPDELVSSTESTFVPVIDEQRCSGCKKCADLCAFNALAVIGDRVLVFPELCHSCEGCMEVCAEDAISPGERELDVLESGNAGQVNYASAKAGLVGLTKSMARELAGRQVTVNCVAPGYILTDMTGELSEDIQENIRAQIPLGSLGTPEDVAGAVAYLASEESGYMTGQTLHVNGGMYMGN